MPYKRKHYTKKRIYKKKPMVKYKRRNALPNGFPDKQLVRMRYCDQIQLDPAIGAVANHVFRANSIFDTDLTGTGYQPYSHDTYQTIYDHYRVVGSRIRVVFMSRGANTSQFAGVCGVRLDDDATLVTNPSQIMETQKSGWKTFGDIASPSVTLWSNYSAKKFHGAQRANSDDTQAQFGANPVELAHFHVWATGQRSTDDAATLDCQVQIDFIVLVSEVRNFAQS